MAFSVNEMLATINANGGISKASKFMVTVSPPDVLSGINKRDFTFFCETAALPGINLTTEDIRMFGYGAYEKRPNAANFTDMPLTFFNDTDGRILSFFHKWLQAVYNFDNSSNPNGTTQGLVTNSFAYPEEYYGTVVIDHFDEVGGILRPPGDYNINNAPQQVDSETGNYKVISYTLHDAFPLNVSDVGLSWDASDALVRIPVTFAYKWWNATSMSQSSVTARSAARNTNISQTQGYISNSLQDVSGTVLNVQQATLQPQINYYSQFLPFYYN